ncbi:MAG: hypothetical protein KBT35_01350 [Firmicutes bacterium]|nr:hypothetical protein [Candidatus Colivicinus equi]
MRKIKCWLAKKLFGFVMRYYGRREWNLEIERIREQYKAMAPQTIPFTFKYSVSSLDIAHIPKVELEGLTKEVLVNKIMKEFVSRKDIVEFDKETYKDKTIYYATIEVKALKKKNHAK